MLCHHFINLAITWHKSSLRDDDLLLQAKALARPTPLRTEPQNNWDHESSHPSVFLTTRDAKPRLFPFPLGKAGGLKGELWWEAGNSAHVYVTRFARDMG